MPYLRNGWLVQYICIHNIAKYSMLAKEKNIYILLFNKEQNYNLLSFVLAAAFITCKVFITYD